MTLLKSIFILSLPFFVNACVYDTYQKLHVSSIENEKEEEKINVFYGNFPNCKYEEIGRIDINGFYFTKQAVLQKLADEGIAMEAEAVFVDYLEQLAIKEYVAVGKAIRCLKET